MGDLVLRVYVDRVIDGDSLEETRMRGLLGFRSRPVAMRVRLFGIAPPELDQPFGRDVRAALEGLARGALDMEVVDTDRYGQQRRHTAPSRHGVKLGDDAPWLCLCLKRHGGLERSVRAENTA